MPAPNLSLSPILFARSPNPPISLSLSTIPSFSLCNSVCSSLCKAIHQRERRAVAPFPFVSITLPSLPRNPTLMAQKTEKEETEFKAVVPENIALCVKCGVAGNSATNNLCPKCFNAAAEASVSTSAVAAPVASSGVSKPKKHVFVDKSFRSSSITRISPERRLNLPQTSGDLKEKPAVSALSVRREVNRCTGCRRKVGLTGFRCRCGELFCADHRYSDRHDCSYDYKTAGREAIARENPVVKAAKIVKI